MNKARHNTHRYLRRAARNVFRTVTLVCVFASQWQAPIPWVHRHVEPANPEMRQCLDRHLTTWHSDVTERGWHLHFAMLDDILRGGGCPVPSEEEGERPARDQLFLVDQFAGSGSVVLTPTKSVFGQHDVWTEPRVCLPERASRRQILGPHAESHRLQTVLCIAQC